MNKSRSASAKRGRASASKSKSSKPKSSKRQKREPKTTEDGKKLLKDGPRGKRNAFMFYRMTMLDQIEREGFTGKEATIEIGKRYNDLSNKEWEKYDKMAQNDVVRYEKQLKDWETKGYWMEEGEKYSTRKELELKEKGEKRKRSPSKSKSKKKRSPSKRRSPRKSSPRKKSPSKRQSKVRSRRGDDESD